MNARPKVIWRNIIFFAVTTLAAVVGCPLYVRIFGVSFSEIALFAFYCLATGMSITAGYHRLFSHSAYKAHPWIQFLFLFFGAAAFEQSALDWSCQHRDHHRYVDTDRDPYDIKKGFFYAHIGWLIFWEHTIHYENVPDLQKNPMVTHQHRHYLAWAVSAGILMPLLAGAVSGHLLGAFLFAICLRLTAVYHATFFINSVCHMFGKATYDINATAKDHWFVAFITNGEGYHNFHHRFPGDYRNGVRWYQWDPTKWLISILSWFGLTRDLKRVSDFRILEARLAAEHQSVHASLTCYFGSSSGISAKILELICERHARLQRCLAGWDDAVRQYRMLAYEQVSFCSRELRKTAFKKMKEARRGFYKVHEQWKALVEMHPLQLKKLLHPLSAPFPAGGF